MSTGGGVGSGGEFKGSDENGTGGELEAVTGGRVRESGACLTSGHEISTWSGSEGERSLVG